MIRSLLRNMRISKFVELKLTCLRKNRTIGFNSRIDLDVKFKGVKPITIGNNVSIRNGAILIPHSGFIKVGNNCSVGAYNILDGSGGLEIGDYVRIGPHAFTLLFTNLIVIKH